jgi:hypothetical protein
MTATALPHVLQIATYLGTISPTLGTIFRDGLPPTPDECISVNGDPGAGGERGFGSAGLQTETPGIQILVRGPKGDDPAAATVAQRIFVVMTKIQAQLLSGRFYRIVKAQGLPFKYGVDDERAIYAINFLCEKDAEA